jgi:hypothetical protein
LLRVGHFYFALTHPIAIVDIFLNQAYIRTIKAIWALCQPWLDLLNN